MNSNIGYMLGLVMVGFFVGFVMGGLIIYISCEIFNEGNVLFTPIDYEDEFGEGLFCHDGTGIVYGGGKTEPYSPYRSSDGHLFIYHDGIIQEMK